MPSPQQSAPDHPHPAASFFAPLLFIGPLAAGVWWLVKLGVYVSVQIEWWCWGGECSTDDWRVLLPIGGILLNVVLAIVMTAWGRGFGLGLAAMTGPLAALQGWSEAVADGSATADSVAVEQWIWGAVAGLGAFIAVIGLVHQLSLTGYGPLLLGAKRVPASLADFRASGGDFGRVTDVKALENGFGIAILTFTSDGRRHAIRVRARRQWLDQPVWAVFRETRPEHARVALSWHWAGSKSDTADTETAPTIRTDPSGSFVTELERLTALRTQGHLTPEEFEAAKRRLLG